MQYKKDAVREKILEAAREEYIKRGYRGGNISAIAARAGVPVGNLYRYFDGKSGVLEAIVRPVYETLPQLMAELREIEVLDSATLKMIMPMLTGKLFEFFDSFGDDILILMDCCEGTKYEDFATDLVNKVSDVIRGKLYPDGEDNGMAHLIGKAFCGSLFDVLRTKPDREQMQSAMEKLIKFYFFEIDRRK